MEIVSQLNKYMEIFFSIFACCLLAPKHQALAFNLL